MNLVGPRPEMASSVATLAEEITRKPCYGLYYIKHVSFGFDLRILLDTVKFVLSGKRPG